MTTYQFPTTPIPSYTYSISSGYKTLVSKYDSGVEQRRSLIRFPYRSFNLIYKYLSDANRITLQNFFTNRKGQSEGFWFVDFRKSKWVDEYVGRGTADALIGALADDGGVKTDETDEANDATANDMVLLPAVPVVNDAYYFGGEEVFDTLRVNIGTQGVGTWTITWEYWNGSGWASLSGVTDGTSGFTAAAGVRDVNFTRPSNWALSTIESISAYWIRARISAYTSITTQPKGTQAWVCLRLYDLHTKSTVAGYKIYVDGVEKVGGGTDYTFITGGGEASVDRILFNSPPTAGSLITSDLEGYLRIKARHGDDNMGEEIETVLYVNIKVSLVEVHW